MSPPLACFQAGNLIYSNCIKCVIVEGKEQCGADQGLLKATCELAQLVQRADSVRLQPPESRSNSSHEEC